MCRLARQGPRELGTSPPPAFPAAIMRCWVLTCLVLLPGSTVIMAGLFGYPAHGLGYAMSGTDRACGAGAAILGAFFGREGMVLRVCFACAMPAADLVDDQVLARAHRHAFAMTAVRLSPHLQTFAIMTCVVWCDQVRILYAYRKRKGLDAGWPSICLSVRAVPRSDTPMRLPGDPAFPWPSWEVQVRARLCAVKSKTPRRTLQTYPTMKGLCASKPSRTACAVHAPSAKPIRFGLNLTLLLLCEGRFC